MLPDQVSNPGPLTYESGALPIALRGPAPWPYNHKSYDRDFLNLSTSESYVVLYWSWLMVGLLAIFVLFNSTSVVLG